MLTPGRRMDVTMMVGESRAMQDLRARVNRVARTTFTVLIEGESGAGKELVAREIHAQSPRHRGPFVAVNCAALVETLVEAELFGIEERTATGVRGRRGKFEQADHGTLFLDEVADLSPTAQAKLLRVLQDMTVERIGGYTSSKVDTRIVVATNRDLRGMVGHGQFRTDLYYRLSGVEIVVPPLRTRREDIPLLVRHFLNLHAKGASITVDSHAAQALLAYDWPGNIRQLGRVLERAVALAPAPEITITDLPNEVRHIFEDVVGSEDGRDDTLRAWSSRYVSLVLARCSGNKRRACQILDISYHTLKSHLLYNARSIRATDPPAESYGGTPGVPALRIDPPVPPPVVNVVGASAWRSGSWRLDPAAAGASRGPARLAANPGTRTFRVRSLELVPATLCRRTSGSLALDERPWNGGRRGLAGPRIARESPLGSVGEANPTGRKEHLDAAGVRSQKLVEVPRR